METRADSAPGAKGEVVALVNVRANGVDGGALGVVEEALRFEFKGVGETLRVPVEGVDVSEEDGAFGDDGVSVFDVGVGKAAETSGGDGAEAEGFFDEGVDVWH